MLDIYVDADGCPVKPEVYKVALRYGLKVILVANQWMQHPYRDWLTLQVIDKQFDGADDWIVENAGKQDIVMTTSRRPSITTVRESVLQDTSAPGARRPTSHRFPAESWCR